jgi:ribosomal protein L40E
MLDFHPKPRVCLACGTENLPLAVTCRRCHANMPAAAKAEADRLLSSGASVADAGRTLSAGSATIASSASTAQHVETPAASVASRARSAPPIAPAAAPGRTISNGVPHVADPRRRLPIAAAPLMADPAIVAFCWRCGSSTPAGAGFCPRCGAQTEAAQRAWVALPPTSRPSDAMSWTQPEDDTQHASAIDWFRARLGVGGRHRRRC